MKIKLQEILDNKNISVYSLSKEIGVTQNNLGKLIKGETTSIKYDILEKICITLKITPNDIFEIDYPYPTNEIYSKSLMKNYNEEEIEIIDPISEMTPTERKEYENSLANYQIRFNLELSFDESVDNFINKIIESFITNIKADDTFKQIFFKYKDYDYFTTNLKVNRLHRILHPFLSIHSKDYNLLLLLDDIKNIYDNGSLEKVSDDKLNELKKKLDYYIDNGINISLSKKD